MSRDRRWQNKREYQPGTCKPRRNKTLTGHEELLVGNGWHHAQCAQLRLFASGLRVVLSNFRLIGGARAAPTPDQLRCLRAVTSISIFMRGSDRPAEIIIAAGLIAPNTSRNTGQQDGKSDAVGRT